MSDIRRSIIIWASGSVLFLSTGLLTAAVFTGPAALTSTNVFASVAAVLQLAASFVCASLLAKSIIRHLLATTFRRLDKHFATATAEDRAFKEAYLRRADDQIVKKSGELERGQRRILDFLQKEGNIQILLGKLAAAERRLVSSVEAGALTNSESLSAATAQSITKVREDIGTLHSELSDLSSRFNQVGVDVGVVAPQMEEMADELGELRAEFVALRAERVALDSSTKEGIDRSNERIDAVLSILDGTSQANISRLDGKLDRLLAHRDTNIRGSVSNLEKNLKELSAQFDAVGTQKSSPAVAGHSEGKHLEKSFAAVQESLSSVIDLTQATRADVKAVGPLIHREGIESVKQIEALIQLLGRVDTSTRRYPSLGGWAMAPDSLLLLSDLVRIKRPQRIVELGSGSSTVWVGTFAKDVGATLQSFEHLEEYRNSTGLMLADFDLEGTVILNLATLTEVEIDGKTRKWYDPQAFHGLKDIEMLIVDGPPRSTGHEPRLPAFKMLRERLAPGALIVVDDLQRGEESEMVRTWMGQDANLAWAPWSAGRTGVLEYKGRERK